MTIVTLIGESLAKKGKEIVYCGVILGCKDCKLKSACLNLEEGRRYVIKNVRDNKHECKIHEGGVRVVELEKVPVTVAMNQKNAVEGAMISFTPVVCHNLGCQYYKLCHPIGLKNGMKTKIMKVGNEINCPEGHNLIEAQLY